MNARILIAVFFAAATVLGCASTPQEPKHAEMTSDERFQLKRDLAFALAAHHEWVAATRPVLDLLAERPNDADLQALLGTIYREQGLFPQAAAAYARALALDPANAHAFAGRGILREVSGGEGDAAIDDFKTAVRLTPGDASFANNLGFALYRRGRYAEAEKAFEDALRDDPLSARTRNNLGFVYGRLGRFDRARREFEHAGNEDHVANNMGWVFEQAGDVRAACAEYARALELNPLSKEAAANRRRACAEKEVVR